MKKQILLTLFFSLTYLGLNAQCNIPFPPALTCASAPVICGSDLDGYCTSLGGINSTDSPSTFCSVVNNNQWFAFVAGSVDINLDFIVGTCTFDPNAGITGFQAQVYSGCGAPWTTVSNCLIQVLPNTTETLVMTGLTVGNVYYLMTDGVAGVLCDYSIQVTSGSTTAPIPDPAGAISGDPVFCPGASTVTYCVPTSFGAAFYDWTIPTGAAIVGADNGECITIDFSGYTGGIGSSGTITVTPTNVCEIGNPSSFTVTQGPPPTGPDQNYVLCPGETATYGNTTYSTAGSFPNTDLANTQGCDILTMVNVVVAQNMTTNLVEYICFGEPPIVVGSNSYNSSGIFTNVLMTSLGCDSTVTLDLTVLDPQTAILPVTDVIDCSGDPVIVSALQINTDPTISYIWSGSCFTQSFPQDPNISVSCGGVYTVYAEQTVAGVTCVSSTYSVTVLENITTPTADPGQSITIDCNANSATLGGSNMSSGANFIYSWTGPNGYTSSQQNPVVTEVGQYCVFVLNATTLCQSTIECVMVTGNATSLNATASNSNDLSCLNSVSMLDASGSSSGGDISYTWDGPGGPYFGSNPSVNQQGTYTLTVMDIGTGCTSTTETIVGGDFTTPTASITTPAAIDCNNPTVSLDGSGSSSGVTYLWSTGETTVTATTNMGAGTYTLTVTNISNGCTDEATVVVNGNSAIITAEVDVQGVLDCDNNMVTLSAINVNGSSNPIFTWSNGMSGQTIMVGTAGSITLTVTDAITGCSGDIMANVANGTNAPTAVAGVSGELNCNNSSVVLSTTGSSTGGNITASWSTADPNNVTSPGIYTLTITNTDNGCTATADVTVLQDVDAPVAAILAPTAIDCNNTTTILDGSGSTGANLSYAWTGPATGSTATLNAATAGTYTLTVTNMDNGCTDTEEIIVVDNTTTVLVTASVSNELTCTQNSATLDVSGGSGSSNPTYIWTGPETGNGSTISVSTPGIYTLTLVDANTGCQGSTTITVLQDDSGPTASVEPANDLTCNVSSVTLDGTASSTGNNITYQWFIGTTAVSPGGNTAIIDVTVAGDYTLVVTDNNTGCETTSSIVTVILDNATPTVSAIAGNNGLLSCSISSLELDGSSSTGNCLSYEWSNNGSVVGTSAIYDASNAGDYILVVTNCDNGCTDQTTVNVMADSGVPNATIGSVVNLDCNNSTSTLQGTASSNTGGTVSVEWFFEGTTLNITDPDYITTEPGEYTFVVTDDGNGCSSSATVQLSENIDPPAIDIATAPIIDCANTIVTVNATNSASGTNISYQWQDEGGVDLPGSETANTLMTSTAGDYILVVTNNDNGCTSTQMVTVPENIEAPVFDASALNNIDCNNMEASLESNIISSFSTDLTYEWELNTTNVGDQSTLSTSNDGDYILIVTDNQNGCSSQVDVTVLNTTQDPTISATASSNGALDCITIETTLDGTGTDTGANFNYAWTLDSDPTTVLSTDLMYTTMDPGIYILTVVNMDNGCVSTEPVTITQSIAPPTSIATSNTTTLTCTDPTITLDGTSSSIGANFSYQWYEIIGGTSTEIVGADMISYDIIVEGTYELVVTNSDNGCTTISDQIVIDQSSDVPVAVISSDGILTCDNGMVIVDGLSSTAGGTLTYQWVDVATQAVLGIDPTLEITTSIEVELNIQDLNSGCTSTTSFLIDENIEDPSANAGLAQTLLCDDTEVTLDGSASSANGDPITYAWADPTGNPGGTTATIDASTPGTWTLTITNTDNGCTSISTVEVGQDTNAPTLSMVPSAAGLNCDIQTITYDAIGSSVSSGSTGNLIYQWTDVASGASLSNTATIDISNTNEVILTITDDGNGCSTSQSYFATQDIEQPTANPGLPQTLFCGDTEVTLDGGASDAGGDAFTYTWTDPMGNSGGTTAQIAASITGNWELLITNTDNGCTSTSTVEVDQDVNVPTAVVDFAGMLTCDVNEITVDGSASSTSSGGALEYEWEGGSVSPTATFDAPGTYTLIITDVLNNCTATQSFTIEEDVLPPVADIQALTSSTISCTEPTLVFTGSASNNNGNQNGGTLTYEWFLNDILVSTATPDQVEISQPGDLELVVTNTNNGCTSTFLLPVDVSDDVPIANVTAPQPLTCALDEVTIIANGSTGSEYTYLWTGPGTIVDETTLTPTVSTTGTYVLTVTNTISGCDISISAQVNGDFNAPNAFANATDQFDCVTDEVTLDGTGSATGSTISYLWSTSTGVIESGQTTFNPVVSAPGDYTLLVTDSGNGCTSISIVTVTANTDVPTIAGAQVIDPNCFGENNGSITLDNVTGGQLPYLYSIDGGALAPINQFSFLSAGEYDILVQDANGCETNQVISIVDPQELLVELGDDQIIGLGDDFQLSAQIVGGYDTIMWSANCPDSICADQPEFSISPLNTVSYNVTVVDGNGCITTDQITINVEKGREVYIPNAFSPNGDGNNDRFWIYPGGEVAKVHEFRVFNRWGEQVFGASNFDPFVQDNTNGWDGTLNNKIMNPAVFVYYVDIEFIDGRREVLKGDVALRR